MNKLNNFRVIKQTLFPFLVITLFLLIVPLNYSTTIIPEPTTECSTGRCEQLKATLRKLEKNPGKLTKMQFIKKVRTACNEMRKRNCPGINNFQPNICFTDF